MSSAPGPAVEQAATIGGPDQVLSEQEVAAFVQEQLAAQDFDGRSVCVLIPDATRCRC